MLSVHPFPARMAPDVAKEVLSKLENSETVLDPMCGSGTVLRIAVELGLNCSGVDIDPLAVLMAQVWTSPIDTESFAREAVEVVSAAKGLPADKGEESSDPETRKFISYWFAERQKEELSRLAYVLASGSWKYRAALSVAFSRIIVSKEMKASLARDTSHSRPHRVSESNDFDTYRGFLHAVKIIAQRLRPELIRSDARVAVGDARRLEDTGVKFDLALTSPPYLNAIDYLRGHRLALVWLGYDIKSLRAIRSSSVGSERILRGDCLDQYVDRYIRCEDECELPDRYRGWIRRYAADMRQVLSQLRVQVRTGGKVVLIVGNSFIRGARVDNSGIIEGLAPEIGFETVGRFIREIPARRRYLPPPGSAKGRLDARMRSEVVLSLQVQ